MSRFVADPFLAELKDFQRATVEHVVRRFYGPAERSTRFLVADETGLGKSMVARGVVARTIEHLQDDPKVERIDIVYICSNADIAAQNLGRLNVTGDEELAFGSRLPLLARHTREFANRRNALIDKPINLVSFSPGTSFDFGQQWGRIDERALLFVLLDSCLALTAAQRRAARVLLQGTALLKSLDREIAKVEHASIDDSIKVQFCAAITAAGHDTQLLKLATELGRRTRRPQSITDQARRLVGDLRWELARVNVAALTPDLVILDEFQRFHTLLDDNEVPANRLAQHLFNADGARVLLLSATPYKPFTYAEETTDNHRASFIKTLGFLAQGCPAISTDDVAAQLDRYRTAATTGQSAGAITAALRETLTQVMTRQERPRQVDEKMLSEHVVDCLPDEDDLLEYVHLRKLSRAVKGDLAMDYWKSVPHFANFMTGYQLGEKVRQRIAARDDRVAALVRRTARLDAAAVASFKPVDLGNARLRQLAADTTDAGWWQLLWLPPSLPYLRPEGPYAEDFAQRITKRLIFSAWAAAPTAIASLLSYEAERHIADGSQLLTENSPEARARVARRLEYRRDGGPAALTTLAMFWPSPELAQLADPRQQARWQPATGVESTVMEELVRRELERRHGAMVAPTFTRDDAWSAFAWPGYSPSDMDPSEISRALRGAVADEVDEENSEAEASGLDELIGDALSIAAGRGVPVRRGSDPGVPLARIALHSPGNIAWRALGRLRRDDSAVTDAGHWRAAVILASGLRALFNRPESTALLVKLTPGDDYRNAVLRYCAWGNLQAVLDEYLHHLVIDQGIRLITDDSLADLAARAREAITLRSARYTATDPLGVESIAFPSRFALRFGGRQGEEDSARQPEIRRAFNSPFWPFVLASTSVGQEGIDLHWWCHAVMHWNVPSNPVDFEQREGRVHRFAGHAVRRNIAHAHGAEILHDDDNNPWAVAYKIAGRAVRDLGEFAPHWVYPGPSSIERHVVPYPLSQDRDRLERVKAARMLYRLTFGQPRQEDMLELLSQLGLEDQPTLVDELRIDLSPPREPIDIER